MGQVLANAYANGKAEVVLRRRRRKRLGRCSRCSPTRGMPVMQPSDDVIATARYTDLRRGGEA